MFFVALATDYDGTLAHHGRVDPATIEALREVKRSGRKLLLVTGRELEDLQRVFSEIELFDLIVAENGALLYEPAKKRETPLGEPPPPALVARLQELGVSPLSVGRSIIATWEPHETAVLKAIHELGLELHIIFNKGAVMVLPTNINKASGLRHALKHLCLSPHNVAGIGDAENDQAFLRACGCAVAVANALPSVKAKADLVVAEHGRGVVELANMLAANDLASSKLGLPRSRPVLGVKGDGSPAHLRPFETVLITGQSGAGKSTVVTALLEQMCELAFQFCAVDPEGDYAEFPDAVVVGDVKREPRIDEIMRLLAKPDVCVVVNLLAVDPVDRPRFLSRLLPEIAKLRSETGRPHWLIIDEAHHCLPADWDPVPVTLPMELPAAIAVTVHPETVAPDFLRLVSTVVGVGDGSAEAMKKFRAAADRPCVDQSVPELGPDQIYLLPPEGTIEVITAQKPKEQQRRHARKYAEGELSEDRSFYFRGPSSALKLRAQNLATFLQLASGVDEATWLHHLRAGEYSKWFRDAIKDEDLAVEAKDVEQDTSLSAADSLLRIKQMVERRYTAPAKSR